MTLLILVVDDEPDVETLFRQQFRRELRSGRFVMEFAQSAPAALQCIADAHAAGLATAQKNSAELVTQAAAAGFDFAVTEECGQYRECDVYQAVYTIVLDIDGVVRRLETALEKARDFSFIFDDE